MQVAVPLLFQQCLHDTQPFRIERLPAHGLACPAIPVGCVALIAFLAMQVGVNPRSLDALVLCWADSCALFQSRLASHQSPASACVSPAGGSVVVSDCRNSFKVIVDSVTRRNVRLFLALSTLCMIPPRNLKV
jgi:hypothetical protein